ncbi:MAG: putative ABC transporter permease [Bacilli bacterium]|nr:putative ABC transporter permease [Bacilli bacterium]
MDIFITIIFLFIVGASLGYIGEVFFRRFVSMHKWINPGFMKGPYLPIYGFGVVILYIVNNIFSWTGLYDLMINVVGSTWANVINVAFGVIVFTIAAVLMELVSGLILLKTAHIRLWDYTNMKGNYQGVICPEFTVIWMVGGILYSLLLNGPVNKLTIHLYNLVTNYYYVDFIVGIIVGMMFIDFCVSSDAFSKISKAAKESKAYISYEHLKLEMKEKALSVRNKSHILQIIDELKNKRKEVKPLSKFKKLFLIDPNKDVYKDKKNFKDE